jgi:glycosyltransferase involved in cell wall biosynthesis
MHSSFESREGASPGNLARRPSVCLLGLANLPVLAEEFASLGVGGEQVQQTLIARALHLRGYEVSMVTYDHGQPDGRIWQGIRVYKAYRQNQGIRALRYFHPRWTGLWSALARANADVYYTSCAGMEVGLAALFCRFNRRGLIFRLASDSDADPKRLLIRYSREKKLYKYGLRRADVVLSQHEGQRENLLNNYTVSSDVADMLVEAPSRDMSLAEKDIDVLWVSNLRSLKRPKLFLELAAQLGCRSMHMVGGADPSDARLYETVEQTSSTMSNLFFHGHVAYKDVGEIYDRSKIFINTSEVEGFPNSFLQSWRRGIPVVSFFDPGGLIRREKLGFIVESLNEMRDVVNLLLTDSTQWHAYAERCLRYMQIHHGDDEVLVPYLRAIRQANKKHISWSC